MSEIPLIHTCWLKPFADYFAERGISLFSYCDHAQIERSHVTSGDGWITKHQLYVFLEVLAKGERMPEVGFVVGERITPDCLGALGEAMAQQETLGGVVRTFGQLINRHVEGNHCWLEEGDDGEVWLFNEKSPSTDPGRTIADQAGLMSMINLVRLVAGPDWYPTRACLQTEVTRLHRKLSGLRNCQMEFNQKATGFAFPTHWLLLARNGSRQATEAELKSPGLLKEGEPIPRKLEFLLSEIIGVGGILPSASLTANLVGVSLRTFHRTLREHQTSYQTILDEVRLSSATELLEETDLPVKEIAFELGYSGANNFIRAFKRWSGTTPAAFREQSQESLRSTSSA